jgi:hypothetical protein
LFALLVSPTPAVAERGLLIASGRLVPAKSSFHLPDRRGASGLAYLVARAHVTHRAVLCICPAELQWERLAQEFLWTSGLQSGRPGQVIDPGGPSRLGLA